MYATVRDMIKAERQAGHMAELVDIGIGKERQVGASDRTSDCEIIARDYPDVTDYDLFVVNGNVPDSFIEKTRAPVVQIIHGRPLSSFRLHQRDQKARVYDIYHAKTKNPRWRAFVTLWPEYLPYWRMLIPEGRLFSVPYAPCDLELYRPDGPKHEYAPEHKATNHVLIADLWRPDTDPFEISTGVVALARRWQNFKVHFLACQKPLGPWEYVFGALRRCGVLGETCGMMSDMPERYRAADVVLTPHYIATRIVRESLACGCTLVAHRLCPYTNFRCDVESPESVARELHRALLLRQAAVAAFQQMSLTSAKSFGLGAFAKSIFPIYEHALGAS